MRDWGALGLPCVFHSHGSSIHMSLLFPCFSHSCVSPIPMSPHSYFSPIPVSISFSCLTHSHSRVSPIPMSLSFSCLSHSYFHPIPKSLSFSCLSHSHVSLVPISRSFSYLSCFVLFCCVCLFNYNNYLLRHSYNPISLLLFL